MSLGDFRRGWEQMGAEGEVLEKFALGFKRLQEAVAAVEDFLGMQTCDGTGRSVSVSVSADDATTLLVAHTQREPCCWLAYS